ncbi:hypothetical protein [Sebaldella sp. S0638]|uniref:hypothetical protein n=1 Tax=Sebaldella sp. S0638 TaxID=2957809 RepID=UPI00209E10DC|nr:hypothetical protein [Sebaldella sp. S0638]MCP1226631.1 hypothetical protein [Sebaldella sp. S0638]
MDNKEISKEERLEIIRGMIEEWRRTGLDDLSISVLTRATVLKDEKLLELFSRSNHVSLYDEWCDITNEIEEIMQSYREMLNEE